MSTWWPSASGIKEKETANGPCMTPVAHRTHTHTAQPPPRVVCVQEPVVGVAPLACVPLMDCTTQER